MGSVLSFSFGSKLNYNSIKTKALRVHYSTIWCPVRWLQTCQSETHLLRFRSKIENGRNIKPSTIFLSAEVGSQSRQVQEGNPDFPLPRDPLLLLLGGPEAFPGQMGYIIPAVSSGSARGLLPGWTCPKRCNQEAYWLLTRSLLTRSLLTRRLLTRSLLTRRLLTSIQMGFGTF